ncbi:MAG: transcription termination/antitermination protein NusG [Verrucomicrobia bacterium]|nr:transcription termination/antitermination protein NusG [Verrucomicrobiota bacterium]MDA1064959.1 transcription termination/antitermination protein NusG [Verrucomicrobiota bacterium]
MDTETTDTTEVKASWYVLQTLSNKENQAKLYLDKYRKQEEMEEFLLDVLLPTETVSEVKQGKKTSKTRKLYPGYVFVHMRLYDENGILLNKPYYFIKGATGVIGFVGGEKPSALKKHEIDRIIAHVQEAEGKEVPKVSHDIGEEVKITDGPFLNLSGKIDEIDPDRGKLKVSVSIFGRFTPVELEYWQVEKNTD